MNYEGGIVHLTITADGRLSLWDAASSARAVSDETYVPLQLTRLQEARLEHARSLAPKAEDADQARKA